MGMETVSITTAYPTGFFGGEIIDIQGCINDDLNLQYEIVACQHSVMILRQPTMWGLLRAHLRGAWLEFRWKVGDAFCELCDIWDEAKEDWRSMWIGANS